MAPHSSTLAWKIPGIEEPGGLQSMGSLRVGHNWATSLSLFLSCIGEGNGNPLQCSCLENLKDRGTWWAAVYGVTQSWTRLKRLSSSFLMVSYSWALLIQYSLFKRITMKIWLFHSLLITTFSVILNMQTSLWGQSSAWCDISPPPSPTSCCSPPYSAPF